ncbi:MAG: glycosyltransferase [Lentisphaerae bacterium]|nr:glycosyltransferase [Lentisphaerota bacterium]
MLDCVGSLALQIPADIEVIVVDAGNKHTVNEQLLAEKRTGTRIIRSERKNVPYQRNLGVENAAGDIVVFLDDDCIVQPGWWPAIVEPFRDNSVAGVAGGIWCSLTPQLTDDKGGYVNIFGVPVQVTSRGAGALRNVDWAVGANMAFRKSILQNLGGFAEIYGIYDEDIDMCLRMRRAGHSIVFVPEAVVYHYFAKLPRKPPTKQSEFHAGRNRSMLLVRNYGFSTKLLLFLVTAPFVHFGKATIATCRNTVTNFGHVAAYIAGMIKGVVVGIRKPVARARAGGRKGTADGRGEREKGTADGRR